MLLPSAWVSWNRTSRLLEKSGAIAEGWMGLRTLSFSHENTGRVLMGVLGLSQYASFPRGCLFAWSPYLHFLTLGSWTSRLDQKGHRSSVITSGDSSCSWEGGVGADRWPVHLGHSHPLSLKATANRIPRAALQKTQGAQRMEQRRHGCCRQTGSLPFPSPDDPRLHAWPWVLGDPQLCL